MDTHRRSVLKALTWRALAMTDTVLLALIFTGSITIAISIGGLELLTKLIWYYVHERVWVRIPNSFERYPTLGKWFDHDGKLRSLIKAISWRFFGAVDTFFIALIFTRQVGISTSIGGTELITKIVLYYLHERAWSHIHWGFIENPIDATILKVPKTRLREFADLLKRKYHIGAAITYAVLCVLFIVVSAAIIYSIHLHLSLQ